jgi:hypothetical protein
MKDEIINFYELKGVKKHITSYPNPNYKEHQIQTPFMSCICSATGGGKTNLLMNILSKFGKNGGTFHHVYLCNSGAHEPLYDYLQEQNKRVVIVDKLSKLPKFEELEKLEGQKLFVFDDLVKVKDQSYIDTLYLRGRKIGCSCIYITQSYFDTPGFLRKQLHYLFLLKVGGIKDLRLIMSNYRLGVTLDELEKIFKDAVNEPMNFLKIDVRTSENNKKFSKNFLGFYKIE